MRGSLVVLCLAAACGENEHPGDGGFVLLPTTAAQITTEAGATTSFYVSLGEAPAHDVRVTVRSSDPREATVEPATFVITPANRPQLVTITGVDDPYVDGTSQVAVEITAPGVPPAELDVLNEDDDTATVIATPSQGLLTSETGTRTSFAVRLSAKPYDAVTLPLASTNPAEGVPDRASVTFTPSNWDLPQTVGVTGVDDELADGARPYAITIGPGATADPAFAALPVVSVSAVNADDDVEAIVVTPTTGLVTTEAGGTATFSVVLGSQPTADVAIALGSSQPAEVTTSVGSLTFSPALWNIPQQVTLTGHDDLVVDGDRAVTIVLAAAASADPRYADLDPDDVQVTNLDDDTPGIVATPAHGLVTSERGVSDHFTVVLHSQPVAAVTIPFASTDPTEGSVYPASLVFTATDWDQPQTITVRGIDDALADGDIAYAITLGPATSTDPVYAGLTGDPVDAINLDNDRAGFVIDPTALTVSELGDTDTFRISLAKRPTANVRITLASSDLSEGFVAPAQLTFTPGNWNFARTVTVTGVDDLLAD
ncbi:MAG: calcium-binding protein, partial [Kofleriaceae bacterium]